MDCLREETVSCLVVLYYNMYCLLIKWCIYQTPSLIQNIYFILYYPTPNASMVKCPGASFSFLLIIRAPPGFLPLACLSMYVPIINFFFHVINNFQLLSITLTVQLTKKRRGPIQIKSLIVTIPWTQVYRWWKSLCKLCSMTYGWHVLNIYMQHKYI